MTQLSAGLIRPDCLGRLAGLPFDYVRRLHGSSVAEAMEELRAAERAFVRKRDATNELLHDAVGRIEDKRRRNRVLELRRRLLDGRPMSPALLANASQTLDAVVLESVEVFMSLVDRRNTARDRAVAAYAADLERSRCELRAMLSDADFQKGLLMSSDALFANVSKYIGSAQRDGTSRMQQIERGLLRYFVRAATKGTPFGRLSAVVPGRVGKRNPRTPPGPVWIDGDPAQKVGFVRMTKALHGILWQHVTSRPAIRRRIVADLNSTVRIEGDRLRFLALVDRRETFQRLRASPALLRVMRSLQENACATVEQLVASLLADPELDATPESAEQYVNRLVDIGLLRLRPVVPVQDAEWDGPLSLFLEAVDDDHAREIASLLRRLRSGLDSYSNADVESRSRIAQSMTSDVRRTLAAVGSAGALLRDILLFEDATALAEIVLQEDDAVSAALELFAEYASLVQPLAYPRHVQAAMRVFFDDYYGNRRSIPLLEFYEDFYREHQKRQSADEAKAEANRTRLQMDQKNPVRSRAVQEMFETNARIKEHIGMRWRLDPTAEEITLRRSDFERALEGLKPRRQDCHSFAALCQVLGPRTNGGQARVVVNSGKIMTGYGKFQSRFLYMIPDRSRARIVERNAQLTTDILAEVCGDADFNPNLHPPLLPAEIEYPGQEDGSRPDRVRPADLLVQPDPIDPTGLHLIQASSGQRVIALDLGFMNPKLRPALYQLLSHFSPATNFMLPVPDVPPMVNADAGRDPVEMGPLGILHRPRVTYEGSVVLARQVWIVPGFRFPKQREGESDADYFIRINEWRVAAGMPQCVYTRVYTLITPERTEDDSPKESLNNSSGDPYAEDETDELSSVADAQPRNGGRDRVKPQFIDFESPLLMTLFARLTGSLTYFRVLVEEAEPTPLEAASDTERAWAYELLLEVDFPAEYVEANPALCERDDRAAQDRCQLV